MRVIHIQSDNASGGFTLIELMITLAISGIIVAAIYTAYIAQQRTYLAQDQVAEMQQNIRAVLMLMVRDIRMAGYDPEQAGGIGFIATDGSSTPYNSTNSGRVSFSHDVTPPTGGPGKLIDYGFKVAEDTDNDGQPDNDTDGDGVPDAMSLGRQTNGGGYQPIAENIQAIEFCYNTVTTLANNQPCTTAPADLDEIRSIQISILARAGEPDRKFTNTRTYTPASGTAWDLNGTATGNGNPTNDNYRRRLLITTVNCRNMGL